MDIKDKGIQTWDRAQSKTRASLGFNNRNSGVKPHIKKSKPGPVTFNVRDNNNPTHQHPSQALLKLNYIKRTETKLFSYFYTGLSWLV